jgi:hypothetical protein
MAPYLSKLGDNGHDNQLSTAILDDPHGPLTQWHENHPSGDPVTWQEDRTQNKDLLYRFRGGPFLVDQSTNSAAYDVYSRIFRCQHEGFTGLTYRIGMRLQGRSKTAPPDTFTVFSIDIPRAVPRTAIRPTGMLDSLHRGRGYQGVKTDDKEFDLHYHVQAEDPQFANALLTPTFKQYLRGHQLPRILSFVFEGNTLSTWNRWDVMSSQGDHFRIDYMSMMIDYLVQIMKVTPRELWQH